MPACRCQTMKSSSTSPTARMGRIRVTDLARLLQWERSRVSHHTTRMERRRLVQRLECAEDGRGAFIVITPQGRAAIEQAAPGHVTTVRRLIFDALTPDEIDALATITDKALTQLQPGRAPPLIAESKLATLACARRESLQLSSSRWTLRVLHRPVEGVVCYLLPSVLADRVAASGELLIVSGRVGAVVLGVRLVDRWRHEVVFSTRYEQQRCPIFVPEVDVEILVAGREVGQGPARTKLPGAGMW